MKQKPPEKSKSQKPSKNKGSEVEKLQAEKDELFEKLQRVSADYANYQKRAPKQIADTLLYEKEKIIKTLLPALDNFEHMLQNSQTADNVDAIIKGVKIVYDQMLDILKSHGVEAIDALGEKFDPSLHQAMMRKSEADREEGIVLEDFQKGYKLNGRVIRPSKVIVNKPAEEEKGDPKEQAGGDEPADKE